VSGEQTEAEIHEQFNMILAAPMLIQWGEAHGIRVKQFCEFFEKNGRLPKREESIQIQENGAAQAGRDKVAETSFEETDPPNQENTTECKWLSEIRDLNSTVRRNMLFGKDISLAKSNIEKINKLSPEDCKRHANKVLTLLEKWCDKDNTLVLAELHEQMMFFASLTDNDFKNMGKNPQKRDGKLSFENITRRLACIEQLEIMSDALGVLHLGDITNKVVLEKVEEVLKGFAEMCSTCGMIFWESATHLQPYDNIVTKDIDEGSFEDEPVMSFLIHNGSETQLEDLTIHALHRLLFGLTFVHMFMRKHLEEVKKVFETIFGKETYKKSFLKHVDIPLCHEGNVVSNHCWGFIMNAKEEHKAWLNAYNTWAKHADNELSDVLKTMLNQCPQVCTAGLYSLSTQCEDRRKTIPRDFKITVNCRRSEMSRSNKSNDGKSEPLLPESGKSATVKIETRNDRCRELLGLGTRNVTKQTKSAAFMPFNTPTPNRALVKKNGDKPFFFGLLDTEVDADNLLQDLIQKTLQRTKERENRIPPKTQYEALLDFVTGEGNLAFMYIPCFLEYLLGCAVPQVLLVPFAISLCLIDMTAKRFGVDAVRLSLQSKELLESNAQDVDHQPTNAKHFLDLKKLGTKLLTVLIGQPKFVNECFLKIIEKHVDQKHRALALLYLCKGWYCATIPASSVQKTPKKKQGENDTPKQKVTPNKKTSQTKKRKLEAIFEQQDAAQNSASEPEDLAVPLLEDKVTLPSNNVEVVVQLDTNMTPKEKKELAELQPDQKLVVNALTNMWNRSY
jgi:hypothetical protein